MTLQVDSNVMLQVDGSDAAGGQYMSQKFFFLVHNTYQVIHTVLHE